MKLLVVLLVVASLPVSLASGDQSEKTVASLAGCYELKLGAWTPDMNLGEDKIFITPPAHIELTLQRSPSYSWIKGSFAIRPAVGAKPSIHNAAEWKYGDNSVLQLLWSTGFSGLSMKLKLKGKQLVGKAETFWDFDRPTQTAQVVANPIKCSN